MEMEVQETSSQQIFSAHCAEHISVEKPSKIGTKWNPSLNYIMWIQMAIADAEELSQASLQDKNSKQFRKNLWKISVFHWIFSFKFSQILATTLQKIESKKIG